MYDASILIYYYLWGIIIYFYLYALKANVEEEEVVESL